MQFPTALTSLRSLAACESSASHADYTTHVTRTEALEFTCNPSCANTSTARTF